MVFEKTYIDLADSLGRQAKHASACGFPINFLDSQPKIIRT